MASKEAEGPGNRLASAGTNILRTSNSRLLGVALIASSAILFLVAFETGFVPFEGASLVSFVLGVALLVVELEPRVRLSVASDAMLGHIRSLDGAMKILRVTGKANYLPQGNQVSMMMAQEGSNRPLLLPPVGAGIHDEIVKELGDTSEKGLDYFELWVPRVLVDNLSMSDSVKVTREGGGIKISMRKPFVRRLCIDPFVNANVCCRMGCPLAGAVAQELAVATGREVQFENCTYDPKTQRAETMLSFGKSG
jgi:hypothetical protein